MREVAARLNDVNNCCPFRGNAVRERALGYDELVSAKPSADGSPVDDSGGKRESDDVVGAGSVSATDPDGGQDVGAVAGEADPVFLDMRKRLFVQGDRDGRAAWGRELMELTALGYGTQADRHLEGVLGLPPYRYHETPAEGRPRAPFDALSPVMAWRSDIFSPEPSRLVYLTPVAMALNLTADDVLYDIGSGLGKAGMFFGAFTPVKQVVGIEIEPAYASYAEARARELGLSHVHFVNRDALEVDLAAGTAFYFYNPFCSTEGRDAVGMLADQFCELGSRTPIKVAVKGLDMQTHLRESGVFAAETVLKDPAVWIVFRSHEGAR
ncbi:MAG: hypothetical protein J2P16_11655 [Mycobacterium sp.]|nr:hypothetical protein [Mycobacterium sp.]